jgi:hypothetical protein
MTPDTPDTPDAVRDRTAKRGEAYKAQLAAAVAAAPSIGQTASSDAPKPKRRQRSNTGSPEGDSAGRWVTLNSFNDTVARHLTLAEQAVWAHLFRWCRDGKASVSTREIASGCGVDKVTATRALAKLKAVGLVWVVSLSRHKGTASVYGLHSRPDRCLQRCMDARRRRSPK